MNIPTIGGTRGIFEIFIPGAFFLINLGAVIYLSPYLDNETKQALAAATSNSILVLIAAIAFGYLIGVLLRLLRADSLDTLSAAWLRRFDRGARIGKGTYRLYAIEEFPYIGWLEEVAKRLPPEAIDFYNKVWAKRKREGHNKNFFNFCKTIITSNDERAANEIYAAEALSRYIVGMYYALVIGSVLILAAAILRYFVIGQIMGGLLFLLLAYFLAIIVIIQHLRFIRIKEVEIVFAASFKNRSLFEEEKKGRTRAGK